MSAFILKLLDGATANVTSDAQIFDGYAEEADLHISGTFDGASVQLEVNIANDDDSDAAGWVAVGDPYTAAASNRIKMTRRKKLRAVLSSAGGSTNIDFFVHYR